MQQQIIKYDLLDNTIDNYVVINPSKPQIAFFPKEEYQMFIGKNYDWVSTNPTSPNTTTEIVNTSTPTDYIGAVNIDIPYLINSNFASFQLVSLANNSLSNFYSTANTGPIISTIANGIQTFRIPTNSFNTILTDPTAITNNKGSNIQTNYGLYYVFIIPSSIDAVVTSILERYQQQQASGSNRRTLIQVDKNALKNTLWNFEQNGNQSGRLYGSVTEILDSQYNLKQTKIIAENELNFLDANNNTQLVLQPDIVGYDTMSQEISVGDILRIYPRETYFNRIMIEINYKNPYLQTESLVGFTVNDIVRDMKSGIFEIYDQNGFTIDQNGNFEGNIKYRYQIFQKNNFEARKRLL